ncbi:MAG: DUF4386 domain-containing protein [Clostridiales bacterium]|nr:DUF4386 domain-containing protein [Clostridiales bacterium]
MKTFRSNSISAGVLLIVAIVAGVLSIPFVGNEAKYADIVGVAQSGNETIIGVILIIVMAAACAGIAIALYPALKKHNPALALGAVGFRIIEAVLFIVAASCLLPIVALGKEVLAMQATCAVALQESGNLLYKLQDSISLGPAAIAFCLGALMYYYIFYRSKLIPRWLSVWGIIAIVMHLVSALLVMFGAEAFSPITLALNLPIALQELTMAIWLIVKGFNLPKAASNISTER